MERSPPGRGRGRGRGFAYKGFLRSLRTADTGKEFQAVTCAAAQGPADGQASKDVNALKRQLSGKCTLKFPPTLKKEEVDKWYEKYRSFWPCPSGGFKGASVTAFWDIENCRPDPDYAPLPLNYAVMMRDAFKGSTDARSFRCVASLSKSYPATRPNAPKRPGDAKLAFEQLTALNAQAGYMYVLTAPGKWDERVHKDIREADDQLKCKMNAFLDECSKGDVAVVISGDQGFVPFCLQAKEKGVRVVVMGPSLQDTSEVLMSAADLFMEWPTFAAFQGKEQRRIPASATTMSPKVRSATEQIQRSHVEQFSCVKELDLVVLLDITHSMERYIRGVHDNIRSVLEQIAVRFPWARQHLRVAFVGYRDFMRSSTSDELDRDQFQICNFGTVEQVVDFLKGVEAMRGADTAEDVIGGLLKVAVLLRRQAASRPAGAAPRNVVLFHICDAPQHGREFNTFAERSDSGDHDTYPDGPLKPLGKAVPPPGRTKPWLEEAREVLLDLKNELNVTKYALVQVSPKYTAKMVTAFKQLVGDPVDAESEWTWKKAAAKDPAVAAPDAAAEPWISTLEMPGGKGLQAAEEQTRISSNLVRMMVSTTLVTITRLSQLVYDKERGLSRTKKRNRGKSVALEALQEIDEVGGELQDLELQKLASHATDLINGGALELAQGDEGDEDAGQGPSTSSAPPAPSTPARPGSSAGAGPASKPVRFDNSTNYKESQLGKMRKDIISKIKKHMKVAVDASEVMLQPPADLDELIESVLDGERYQRAGKEPPRLLQPMSSPSKVKFMKTTTFMAEGAQRLVYEAIRSEAKGPKESQQDLVVMKEFSKSYAHGNSIFRYTQMCEGNAVAAYLANIFNAECAESGINEVGGKPRPELVYIPMWVASWEVQDSKADKGVRRCHHHIEPYILGKYIKYNSNDGAINMETLDHICHTFSHWSYTATKGLLMVTDVQGVKDHKTRKIMLTDPAIICVPLVEGFFEHETNRGPFGILEFFSNHVCSDACKKLGLRSSDEELAKLRADALAGNLPGRCGTPLDLDAGL